MGRAGGEGNLAVLLGSTTGRDGIGGVSVLASAAFGDDAETEAAKRPNVQVGDPFEEKRLIEATLELLDKHLVLGIQDLGGAGITCATSETASRGGVGMDVNVDAVPLREPGLAPFEVMTSESQERMLAIVTPGAFSALFEFAGDGKSGPASSVKSPGQVACGCCRAGTARCWPTCPRPACTRMPPFTIAPCGLRRGRARKCPPRKPPPDLLVPRRAKSRTTCYRCWPTPRGPTASTTTSCSATRWWRPGRMRPYSGFLLPGRGLRPALPDRGIALSTDGNQRWCALDPRAGTRLVVAESALNVACAAVPGPSPSSTA